MAASRDVGEQGWEAEDILQLRNDGVDKEGGNNTRDDNTRAAYCSLVLSLPPLATAFLILCIQGTAFLSGTVNPC